MNASQLPQLAAPARTQLVAPCQWQRLRQWADERAAGRAEGLDRDWDSQQPHLQAIALCLCLCTSSLAGQGPLVMARKEHSRRRESGPTQTLVSYTIHTYTRHLQYSTPTEVPPLALLYKRHPHMAAQCVPMCVCVCGCVCVTGSLARTSTTAITCSSPRTKNATRTTTSSRASCSGGPSDAGRRDRHSSPRCRCARRPSRCHQRCSITHTSPRWVGPCACLLYCCGWACAHQRSSDTVPVWCLFSVRARLRCNITRTAIV